MVYETENVMQLDAPKVETEGKNLKIKQLSCLMCNASNFILQMLISYNIEVFHCVK